MPHANVPVPFSVAVMSAAATRLALICPVGVAGVAGNGQSELFDALSGETTADRADAVRIDGAPWNKRAPAPAMPAEVAERTAAKYREAFERLTA